MRFLKTFEDNKLSSLDTTVWIEGLTILFDHYGKPMSTYLVVQARSAIIEDVKVSSLAEDVSRILRNTSTIKEIVGYENKVKRSKLPKSNPCYMPLYTGSFNSHGRARSKAQKKNTWYKSKNMKAGPHPAGRKTGKSTKKRGTQTARKVQPSSVVFVPNIRGGLVTKKLKEKEDNLCKLTGFWVKFQEAGGLQLKNCFSTDFSRGEHCGRKVCPPCNQGAENRQNCRTQNILYETKCLICNPTPTQP